MCGGSHSDPLGKRGAQDDITVVFSEFKYCFVA